MALGVLVWILPVLLPDDEMVRERVLTHEAGAKVTVITQHQEGWHELHSEAIAIALLGVGLSVFAVGALPPRTVASIKTPFGEVTFTEAEVEEVVKRVTKAAVPEDKVPAVVTGTLREIGTQRLTGAEAFKSEIDATITKVIEEEAEEEDEDDDETGEGETG
ncbi:MAG: hypothetical protein AB7F97_14780 [Solirubrobacterales bacterium]